MNLVYHSLQHGRPGRKEENRTEFSQRSVYSRLPEHGLPLSYLYLIVSSGKSEAELTNNRIALDVLKLTTDRHEASRGLSATAGLVVS